MKIKQFSDIIWKKSRPEETQLKLNADMLLLQKGFEKLLCTSDLSFEPKPWQLEAALKTLRDFKGSGILADEVGLGKTIEAGLIMNELLLRGLASRILILVPAPLIEQWKLEMHEKFSIDVVDVKTEGWEEASVIISSISLASRSKEKKLQLQAKEYDLVIVDEAHCLKNHHTAMYKFVYSLKRKNTILMSATPIQNDLRELFNLVNVIKPGYLKSRRIFRTQYMENRYTPKNVEKLRTLLSEVMIRNRRANTLVELPKRQIFSTEVEFSYEEKQFHNDLLSFCRDVYREYIKGNISVGWDQTHVDLIVLLLMSLLKQNTSSHRSAIRTLKTRMLPRLEKEYERDLCLSLIRQGERIGESSKLNAICKHIESNDEQYIIYTEYLETIAMLKESFINKGIAVTTYHGSMNAKEKGRALEEFRLKQTKLLISSESGGQGLNLQFCHNLINYDFPWNPMKIEQRIGRVHRFGQTEKVNIYSFPVKGTIDEYLIYILAVKLNLFESVIGELDTIMSYMIKEDENLEIQIGKIILESENTADIEAKLREIGEKAVIARKEYEKEEKESREVLDNLGVE